MNTPTQETRELPHIRWAPLIDDDSLASPSRPCHNKATLSRRVVVFSWIFLLSLAFGLDTEAITEPENERGFDPDKVFQVGEVDHVNLFNGNVLLTIPVGGGLSLVYNSNLWNFDVFSLTEGDPGSRSFTLAEPAFGFNAGVGWTVLPGQLQRPATDANQGSQWTFIGPDGAQHAFYPTLHEGDIDENAVPTSSPVDPDALEVGYTRDGSYLRMLRLSLGVRRVEMPDGSHIDFEDPDTPHLVDAPIWLPRRREDAFGNFQVFTYTSTTGFPDATWDLLKITDRFGRVTELEFELSGGPVFPRLLKEIRVPSFAGSGSLASTQQAIWRFEYVTQHTYPSCPHRHPTDNPGEGANSLVSMPFLSRVEMPDGSAWSFLEYNTVENNTDPSPPLCSVTAGRLRKMQVPTQGIIEWTYQAWNYPVREVDLNNQVPPPGGVAFNAPSSVGVHERIYSNRQGVVESRWTYDPQLGPPDPSAPNYMTVTVTDPVGNRAEHFFSVDRDGKNFTEAGQGWRVHDYGLPFSRHESATFPGDPNDPSDDVEVYLSRRIYDVDGVTPLRSIYVRYERDVHQTGLIDMGRAADANRRQVATMTIFEDDPQDHWAGDASSNFDGFGHYRKMLKMGSLPFDRVQTGFTAYDAAAGEYSVDANGAPDGTFFMPSVADKPEWILNTFTHQESYQAADADQPHGERTRVEVVHDPQTGAQLCRRVLADNDESPTRTQHDVFTLFTYNPWGERIRERVFGGDNQSLPTGLATQGPSGCQLSGLPAVAEYRQDNTYQFGALAQSQWVDDGNGQVVLRVVAKDIDANTGLPWKTHDAGGVEMEFAYDALGRMTWVDPEGNEEPTNWSYSPATAASHAQARSFRAGNSDTEMNYVFDDWGRPCTVQEKLADGTWSNRQKVYDAAGRLTVETVAQPGTPSLAVACSAIPGGVGRTTYGNFDGLGRARMVTGPDGSVVSKTFIGNRVSTEEVSMATLGGGGEELVKTASFMESSGKTRVISWAAGRSDMGSTSYRYAVEGHQDRVITGVEVAQRQYREMIHDGRGLMISETLPEIGTSGNGTLQYRYDSLGKPIEKTLDQGSTLRYRHDRAGRLVAVQEVTVDGSERPLKEFYYHRSNVDNKPTAGKLSMAKRHNYGRPPGTTGEADLIVTEIHRYGALNGRKSETETRLSGRGLDPKIFRQVFTWSTFGQLAGSYQPQCVTYHCAGVGATHKVNRWYQQGHLRGVSGIFSGSLLHYAQAITYHPSGLLKQVMHGNGVLEKFTADSSGLPRPSLIRADRSGVAVWSTQAYQYDGASNIKAMGTDRFVYDGRGRLTSATLGSVAGSPTRGYTYDTYGNLISINRGGSVTSMLADTTSNRLLGPANSAIYDANGSLLQFGAADPIYGYDAEGMLVTIEGNGVSRGFAYTADGERILELDFANNIFQWTLRGPENKPVRRWRQDASGWTVEEDYVYRAGKLLVSLDQSGNKTHHYLDHLGTPRYAADADGNTVAQHTYFPYGEEATTTQDGDRIQFTGHERDDLGSGTNDDLDYMHARYYSPYLTRFLSVDPGRDGTNLYGYGAGNPVKYLDPDGREIFTAVMQNRQARPPNKNSQAYYLSRGLQVPTHIQIRGQYNHAQNRAMFQSAVSGVAMYYLIGRAGGSAILRQGAAWESRLLAAKTRGAAVSEGLSFLGQAIKNGTKVGAIAYGLGVSEALRDGSAPTVQDALFQAGPDATGGVLTEGIDFLMGGKGDPGILTAFDLNAYPRLDPTQGFTLGDVKPEEMMSNRPEILQDSSP